MAEQMVYQLKITLRYSRPPIWRRVLVSPDTTLAKLHRIIQAVMGWHNSHLHEFETPNGERYGDATERGDEMFGMRVMSEKRAKLGEVLTGEKQRLVYIYDLGDSWEHDIVLEKIIPADPGQRYPVCIKGKRATPPEDVGGIPDTKPSSKPSPIPVTKSMRCMPTGLAVTLTPRHSIWRP